MAKRTYNKNKNIKLIKKEPTPTPKVTPTPTPTTTPVQKTELEELLEWAQENRSFFFNSGKKKYEDLVKMYRLYNLYFNQSQPMGSCGKCHYNIQQSLKRKLF